MSYGRIGTGICFNHRSQAVFIQIPAFRKTLIPHRYRLLLYISPALGRTGCGGEIRTLIVWRMKPVCCHYTTSQYVCFFFLQCFNRCGYAHVEDVMLFLCNFCVSRNNSYASMCICCTFCIKCCVCRLCLLLLYFSTDCSLCQCYFLL